MSISSSKNETRMTEGNIIRLIISFTMPLLIGNIFQQLYNMVDTWVVGNFVSDNAFAAVGNVGPILNIYIFAFTGFAGGAGVVVSQFFGAKDFARVKKTVDTMVVITVVACVLFTLVGSLTIPLMLKIAKSPAGVYEEQIVYLRIIFAFISFQIIYNMASSILRAVGDSRHPFIFLVVACITNIVLDLLFVVKFDMGVAGVAWATIIAQGVSALLCIITLLTTDSSIRLSVNNIEFDKRIAKQIIVIGFPTALQQMVTAFSNVFVQSYINILGTDVMGGWTCYSKVDMIVMLPMQSACIAAQTFVGQNLGSGNEPRAREGLRKTNLLSFSVTAVLVAAVVIFAPATASFFTDSPEMIRYGAYFMRLITPFMLLSCISMITLSALRGAGNSTMPMIFTLASYVVFRQIYLFIISRLFPGNILSVGLAYPLGWILCSVLVLTYYHRKGFGNYSSIAHNSEK